MSKINESNVNDKNFEGGLNMSSMAENRRKIKMGFKNQFTKVLIVSVLIMGFFITNQTSLAKYDSQWASQQGDFWDTQKWVAGDFNGDKKTDIACICGYNGKPNVFVHLSTGSKFIYDNPEWASQQEDLWSTKKWVTGDFDGDKKTDLACIYGNNGKAEARVHLSTGESFANAAQWASPPWGFWGTQKWVAGDFDGDKDTDLACVLGQNGKKTDIRVSLSTGNNFAYDKPQWVSQQGDFYNTQKWVSGDFDGDGKTDLACIYGNDKTDIQVYLSSGSSFAYDNQAWARQKRAIWDTQIWFTGDFDGDQKTDLACIYDNKGKADVLVHLSTGKSFANAAQWANQQGGLWDTQKWIAGDFNGDGKTDLACIYGVNDKTDIQVHLSTGSNFNY